MVYKNQTQTFTATLLLMPNTNNRQAELGRGKMSFWVNSNEREVLDELAAYLGTSRSEVIRTAIEYFSNLLEENNGQLTDLPKRKFTRPTDRLVA